MIDWQKKITNTLLDTFVAKGYLVLNNCFDKEFVDALQQESGLIDYKVATLTHGERVSEIRGDSIRWIDSDNLAGMEYLQAIEDLGEFFNRTLYTGIRHCEAHYARYPSGFGYDWHVDNPKGRDERVISAVFYLNENWQPADGGQITLVDKQNSVQQLFPKANRLVLFDSNLRHQVAITQRPRFSIATWLRRA